MPCAREGRWRRGVRAGTRTLSAPVPFVYAPAFALLRVAHPVVPEPVSVRLGQSPRVSARSRVPWGRKPNEPAGPLGLELAPQILGQHPSQAREEVGPVEGRRLDCIGGEEGEKASGREGKRARAVSGVGERSDCAHVRMRAHVPGSPRNCFLPLSFHADTHQSVGSLRRTGRSAWKYSKKSGETSRSSAG